MDYNFGKVGAEIDSETFGSRGILQMFFLKEPNSMSDEILLLEDCYKYRCN